MGRYTPKELRRHALALSKRAVLMELPEPIVTKLQEADRLLIHDYKGTQETLDKRLEADNIYCSVYNILLQSLREADKQ